MAFEPALLLPDATTLRLEGIIANPHGGFTVHVSPTHRVTCCPVCHEPTAHIHSRYCRTVADLPWAEHPIKLRLHVRKFVCRTATCARAIFTERLPSIVAPSARRTIRLAHIQRQIALAVGGVSGQRLSTTLAMPVGDDTLCTLMRQTPLPAAPTPRILGVDDWAIRKGQTYATILVDLETGRPIDLLSERSADQFAQWLKDHPGITIISRDRGTIYAEGATTGAPDALHVADRWHILKNLGDTLVRVLEQHHHALTTAFATATRAPGGADSAGVAGTATETVPNALARRTQEQQARHAAKCARQAQVQQLHAAGCSLRAIAAQTGLERKTVRKYLQLPVLPPPQARGQRSSLLDPYKAYLVERWNAGCGNAMQLLSEIQRQGFQGQRSTVRAFVTQLRKDQGLAPRSQPKPHDVTLIPRRKPPTLRTLTWLVIRHPATLHADQQSDIDVARQAHPAIATAITLAQEFAMLVRRRAADGLTDWLDRATTSGSMPFRNFAKSLRQDEAAIRAALTLRWSNGPVEGHINRRKLLKRQAYGRAKLDLLRVRLLTR